MVRFPLPDSVFLPCDRGMDFDISLSCDNSTMVKINRFNQSIDIELIPSPHIHIYITYTYIMYTGAWRYCLGHGVLSCMTCVVKFVLFVFALSQLHPRC